MNTTKASKNKTKSDIREYTRVIIRKNGEYLQGRSRMTGSLVWSNSPWDAWWTRNAQDARDVARETGGTAMLFNPVIGKVAVM